MIVAMAVVTSCRNGNGENGHDMTASMEEVSETLIPLDSTITQQTGYFQQLDDTTIIFLNRPTYELCTVNLSNNKINKTKIFTEGPNAVNSIDAFCYVGPDSIWLYASWGKELYMIDTAGVVKTHFGIPQTKPDGTPLEYATGPFPTGESPYRVIGDTHILQGWGSIQEGSLPGVTMVYNASDSSVTTGNPYPEIYGSSDELTEWSLMAYRLTSYALTPSGMILTNFPASDSLYVYNPQTRERTAFFAGHSTPTNITHGKITDQESMLTNYLERYRYPAVFYDRFNDVYYRLLFHPLDNYNKDDLNNEIHRKPLSIVILDGDLNVIGETDLPQDTYYVSNSFVTPEGLHLQVYSEDDDFMRFRVFKLNR